MAFIEQALASRMEASAGNNNKSNFHITVDATFPSISRPIPVVRATKKNLSRRLSLPADDLVTEVDTSQHWQELESVVGNQWQVYHVSPLWNVPIEMEEPVEEPVRTRGRKQARTEYNSAPSPVEQRIPGPHPFNQPELVRYDEKALKRYSLFLTGQVATHVVSGMENPYKVDITSLKGLKGRRTDRDALKIVVTSRMNGEIKYEFEALLCGVEAAELQLVSNSAVNLPVMLAAGNQDITERVIFGLEKCFDCVIGPLELPSLDLHWMAAMWAGLDLGEVEEKRTPHMERDTKTKKGSKRKPQKQMKKTAGRNGTIKLTYLVPSNASGEMNKKIRHITVFFPEAQIKEVWDGIHTEGGSDFTKTEMEEFHSILGGVVEENSGVRLQQLSLAQISLPFFRAHQSGKVKVECVRHVRLVLRYLTELCQGNMFQADPSLGVEMEDDSMEQESLRREDESMRE